MIYDFLLVEVKGMKVDEVTASGHDEFKDPQLASNTKEASDLLRGRFEEDKELDNFITVNLDTTNYL